MRGMPSMSNHEPEPSASTSAEAAAGDPRREATRPEIEDLPQRLQAHLELSLEFKVPPEVRDPEAFLKWTSSQHHRVHSAVEGFLSQALAFGEWATLTPQERRSFSFGCLLISEEGLTNLVNYGLAGLTSKQKDGVMSRSEVSEREAGLEVLKRGLESGAIHSKQAAIVMEVDAQSLKIRFRDTDGFPDFEQKVAERRTWHAHLHSGEDLVDESRGGRGIMLMVSFFQEVYLDRANGDRVCGTSVRDLKARLKAEAA